MKYTKLLMAIFILISHSTVSWATDDGGGDAPQKKYATGLKPTPIATIQEIEERSAGKLKVMRPKPKKDLPAVCDLSQYCEVEDQGGLGACTAHALNQQLRIRQLAQMKAQGQFGLDRLKSIIKPTSRLFIYYNERYYEGTVNEDAGASIGSGMKSLYEFGAPKESYWTYSDQTSGDMPKFMQKPPAIAYAKAKDNRDLDGIMHDRILPKGNKYASQDLMQAIFEEQPLAVGMMLHESFMSDQVAKTGMVPLPKRGEKEIGGHAVLLVGYDKEKGLYKFVNSWGEGWGDKGFFYLTKEHMTKDYMWEIWRLGEVSLPSAYTKLLQAVEKMAANVNNGENM